MSIDLSSYNDVASRIREFAERHPSGSLQPADPTQPYRIETIGERTFVVYVAAAYRDQDDTRPGIGVAWEPYPGKSNYTRDSELQNAETSAWGRAIVAALAADTKKGVASREEVALRQEPPAPVDPVREVKSRITIAGRARGLTDVESLRADYAEHNGGEDISSASLESLQAYLLLLTDRERA